MDYILKCIVIICLIISPARGTYVNVGDFLAPPSQIQPSKDDKKDIAILLPKDTPLHVEVPFDNFTLDFILSPNLAGILREAEIDPQQFLEDAIWQSVKLPVRRIRHRWRNFSRRGSRVFILDVETLYDRRLVQAVGKDLVKKLLIPDVWESIIEKRGLDIPSLEDRSKTIEDFNNFFKTQISSEDLIEIAIGFLSHQMVPPFQLSSLLVSDGSFQRDPFTEEQFSKFKDFFNANVDQMSIESQIIAYKIMRIEMVYREERTGKESDELKKIQRELKLLDEKKKEIHSLIERTVPLFESFRRESSLKGKIEYRQKIVELQEQTFRLDPNSRERSIVLAKEREWLLELVQEKEAREEAKARVQAIAGASAEILLAEAASSVTSNEEYFGSELLQLLSKRDDLTLYQINVAIVLLPKVVTSYKEASEIYRNLTAQYRQSLIREVLIDFKNLSIPQQEALAKALRHHFEDADSMRLDQIRSQPELADVKPEILEVIQSRFRELKDQLDDLKIELSQALEKATSERLTVDVGPYLQPRRELVYLNQTLKNLLNQEKGGSPAERLKLAKEYFRAFYGVDLTVPFKEETPLYEVPIGVGEDARATLYSKEEISDLLKRLILVDRWLSILPRGVILTSLSFQNLLIVKKMRAYYGHSESVKMNKIALALENPDLKHTLYHEFGHSLHGPIKDFATFVDLDRVRLVLLKHRELFEPIDSKLFQSVLDGPNIPMSERGVLLSKIFQALFNKRLDEWKRFYKEKAADIDINDPLKVPDGQLIEDHYGIKTVRGEDPSIDMIYVFEIPLSDKTTEDKDFVRKTPEEMIAEYTQLYLLHPEALEQLDPVAFDLFSILLGEAHSQRRREALTESGNGEHRDFKRFDELQRSKELLQIAI